MTTAAASLPVSVDESGQYTGIAVLTLEQPDSPVVVLNEELIRRLEATLRSLPKGLTGLVLASASTRVFVAGADLKTIQASPTDPDADRKLDAYLAYGQRVFGMLCDLPFPTAAAIGGAALGGGLELAMHCDGLIGAPNAFGKPYPVGLPEAGLSICPGWGGTNLLPARMDPAEAIKRTATGRPMVYDEAVAAGMFDRIAPGAEELIPTAKAWVKEARTQFGTGTKGAIPRRDREPSRWIGRPDRKSSSLSAMTKLRETAAADGLTSEPARAVLDAVTTGLEVGWQGALDLERRELVRLRNTPAGKAAIQAFFDKAKK
jgi:enoyl-CoA hydratase/carnithine racemase